MNLSKIIIFIGLGILLSSTVFAHNIISILSVNTSLVVHGSNIDMATSVELPYDATVATTEEFIKLSEKYFNENIFLHFNNYPCFLKITDAGLYPKKEGFTRIMGIFHCPENISSMDDIYIKSTLFDDYGSAEWNNFIDLQLDGKIQKIVIDRNNYEYIGKYTNSTLFGSSGAQINNNQFTSTENIVSQNKIEKPTEGLGFFGVMKKFIFIGIEHILSGTDHILFVIALIMVVLSFREILYLTTSFTLAHSITLILAGFGVIHVTAKIVEPIIAFSIVFMAVQNILIFSGIYKQKYDVNKRLFITAGFGLFHGLGFAGSLADVDIPSDYFLSSLLSFNIGVEIGQLIIIGLAFPFIWYMRKHYATGGKIGLQGLSIMISIIAIYWVLERILS